MSEEHWTMDDVKRWLETEKIASEVQARVMQRLDRVFLEIKVMAQLSEREACAKIAEEKADALDRTAKSYGVPQYAHEYLVRATDARDLAAAIRARGKTE